MRKKSVANFQRDWWQKLRQSKSLQEFILKLHVGQVPRTSNQVNREMTSYVFGILEINSIGSGILSFSRTMDIQTSYKKWSVMFVEDFWWARPGTAYWLSARSHPSRASPFLSFPHIRAFPSPFGLHTPTAFSAVHLQKLLVPSAFFLDATSPFPVGHPHTLVVVFPGCQRRKTYPFASCSPGLLDFGAHVLAPSAPSLVW